MSREYKFRGKSIKGFGNNLIGTWFYGGIITNPHGKEMHIGYFDKDMLSWRNVPVDPETVGQYTGLKDKNGKEIYEGDIVKGQAIKWAEYGEYGGTRETLGVVKFDNARFFLWDMDTGARTALALGSAYHEVIGNIYEHHHLLKEEETK